MTIPAGHLVADVGDGLATGADLVKAAKDKGGKDGKRVVVPELNVEPLAELPGVVVSALTRLPDGDLLAATLPGGSIHRVNAKGKVSRFATLEGWPSQTGDPSRTMSAASTRARRPGQSSPRPSSPSIRAPPGSTG